MPAGVGLRYCVFFQAEDGIRSGRVTGVQTCPLPISLPPALRPGEPEAVPLAATARLPAPLNAEGEAEAVAATGSVEIGRAWCRERGEGFGGAGASEERN